jgi:drug/metabolite transporter (DMT)-like permease
MKSFMPISEQQNHPVKPTRIAVILAFLSVYFCWGATYAAMRVGVHFLPPMILAGTRLLLGAAILLGANALRGQRIFWPPAIMARLGLVGLLLLFGGNIILVWSETYIPSGLAALLVAVVPLYVVVMEMILPGGDRLSVQGYLGLFLGFAGLVVLVSPSLRSGFHGHSMQLLAIVGVLGGALSFASGSVLSRRMRLPVNPLVAAGWQMGAAGLADTLLATMFREWRHAIWNWHSIGAISYLVIFGSLLGFSCYIWLIAHVPVAKVATYAFVNPVVAVIVGAVLLGEHPGRSEYMGMAGIVLAVMLVVFSQMKSGTPVAEKEVVPVEAEA